MSRRPACLTPRQICDRAAIEELVRDATPLYELELAGEELRVTYIAPWHGALATFRPLSFIFHCAGSVDARLQARRLSESGECPVWPPLCP